MLLEGCIIDHGERSRITHRRSIFAFLAVICLESLHLLLNTA